MNRIRAALPWRKKNYHGDSDSTGYCSSSELSKTLSDSQFILRPNTALLSTSYSNCTNYYALDYSEFSPQNTTNPRNRSDPKATITSRSSTISSTTFKSHSNSNSQSLSSSSSAATNSAAIFADDEDEKSEKDDKINQEQEEEDDDETSTIRANSVRRAASAIPMMPQLTSIKHLMGHFEEDELATIDEITTSYEFEEAESDLDHEGADLYDDEDEEDEEHEHNEEDDDDDDDVTIDIAPPKKRREIKNSSFRSFPFSYKLVENEMDRLFDMLQVDEQLPSTSSLHQLPSELTMRKTKRLLIKEPTSKIYYREHSISEALPLPPVSNKVSIMRTESAAGPRSILKNSSSFAIYEEIYGDHRTPLPTDIRPRLPERPILAFQQFPPCTTFQPKHPQRLPSIRRRKKLPSLHHSTSFASYFKRKK